MSVEPAWADPDAASPLGKLAASLSGLIEEAQHDEIWGVALSKEAPYSFQTKLVLQKFLRANADDVSAASVQLLSTLKWRKEFNALGTIDEPHSAAFNGLGYICEPEFADGSKMLVTFNIYGAIKEPSKTFADLDAFLRWRVGLMELALRILLHERPVTQPIPDYGKGDDPVSMIQVHDYLNVSFLRMDPKAKAASSATISIFSKYYPELLSQKYFVNVPYVMSWLYAAVKLTLSASTVKKFHVLANASGLAGEMGTKNIPKAYGGVADDLPQISKTLQSKKPAEEGAAPASSSEAEPKGDSQTPQALCRSDSCCI